MVCNITPLFAHTSAGVMKMLKKRKREPSSEDLRLNPELRLCERFDATSVSKFPDASPGFMGVRVIDNCAEEHIM